MLLRLSSYLEQGGLSNLAASPMLHRLSIVEGTGRCYFATVLRISSKESIVWSVYLVTGETSRSWSLPVADIIARRASVSTVCGVDVSSLQHKPMARNSKQ